jgi:hypothetical protein
LGERFLAGAREMQIEVSGADLAPELLPEEKLDIRLIVHDHHFHR